MRRMVPVSANSLAYHHPAKLSTPGVDFMHEPAADSRFGFLCSLIREGSTDDLDWELQQDPSLLRERDADNNNALHYCVKWRRLDAAATLCSHGADTDAANRAGHTAGTIAACVPDAASVRALLELRKKYKSKRAKLAARVHHSAVHQAARPSSTDSLGIQDVRPGVNVHEWGLKLKEIKAKSREKFDRDSGHMYDIQGKTQERIDEVNQREPRVQQLRSWADGQRAYLNEQRQKRLESDWCMQVKMHSSKSQQNYSLRPAPWGGLCRSAFNLDRLILLTVMSHSAPTPPSLYSSLNSTHLPPLKEVAMVYSKQRNTQIDHDGGIKILSRRRKGKKTEK